MKKQIIILFACVFLIPISCKKYEEGPWISFRSPMKRLINKDWHVESYKVDGIEKIQDYKDSCGCSFNFAIWDFNRTQVLSIRQCNFKGWTLVSFDFSNDDNKLLIGYGSSFYGGDSILTKLNYFTPLLLLLLDKIEDKSFIEWEIIKLTSNKLKMKTILNNKEYEVEMYN